MIILLDLYSLVENGGAIFGSGNTTWFLRRLLLRRLLLSTTTTTTVTVTAAPSAPVPLRSGFTEGYAKEREHEPYRQTHTFFVMVRIQHVMRDLRRNMQRKN